MMEQALYSEAEHCQPQRPVGPWEVALSSLGLCLLIHKVRGLGKRVANMQPLLPPTLSRQTWLINHEPRLTLGIFLIAVLLEGTAD